MQRKRLSREGKRWWIIKYPLVEQGGRGGKLFCEGISTLPTLFWAAGVPGALCLPQYDAAYTESPCACRAGDV